MIYYKYLDLDYQSVAEKIRIFLKDRPNITDYKQNSWVGAPREIVKEVPEVINMFKPLGLNVAMIGFFTMYYKTGPIHTDADNFSIRINFPILNCEDTETRYFKTSGPGIEYLQPNGKGYVQYQPDQCEQVDSFKLTQAVVMRVLEPHQVILNHDNFPRISCTVSFKQDLTYLLT